MKDIDAKSNTELSVSHKESEFVFMHICVHEHVNMSSLSECVTALHIQGCLHNTVCLYGTDRHHTVRIYLCVCVWERVCFHKGVYSNNQERDGPLKTSQWEMDVETDAASETGDQ